LNVDDLTQANSRSNYIPSLRLNLLQPGSSNLDALIPMKPFHMILTLRNPLFDPVKVTLATPSRTPGRFQSKITILCPQFEIGQNTDVWDEALSTTDGKEKRRTKTEVAEGQAEAGKVWEKGRNWTSIVLEVVPASLDTRIMDFSRPGTSEKDTNIAEDEDVLEIPVFFRIEYETEANAEDDNSSAVSKVEKEKKEKRELAYWIVLGVGRLAKPSI
jgi:dynactin-4